MKILLGFLLLFGMIALMAYESEQSQKPWMDACLKLHDRFECEGFRGRR